MVTERCWKCKVSVSHDQGKMSNSGFFTCYNCLKKWNQQMQPIWKYERDLARKQDQKKQIQQMDIFELHDTLNTIFS